MNYGKKLKAKPPASSKFKPVVTQFLLLNMCVAPGTKPAVGIRNGVQTTFLAIKEATSAEIALMPKPKPHLPIINKAMLPKKHCELRFYGEVQVPN